MADREEHIAVVGLGYVGLPVACAFGAQLPTLGFDINRERVEELGRGYDRNGESSASELAAANLRFSADQDSLKGASVFIVTVPTPIDESRQPDLSPVVSATRAVARSLSAGSLVIYESTVYPGVTEEVCRPLLEEVSGLVAGVDFFVGYSPERINPGDREHTFTRIKKVVAGENPEVLERVAGLYERVVLAGVHRAPSIKVAEAAKVIENTQRDLNIALMNELALIFDRLDIKTADVLAAAGTKWNFLPFSPGLVGGHCIGVDPYYLTAKAERVGYHPEVILAGRRINDGMGAFVAQKALKLLATHAKVPIGVCRVGIYGITFKENVSDIRNSRVPDIITELRAFGVSPIVHDPLADAAAVHHEYAVELAPLTDLDNLDVLIVAVPHRELKDNLGRLKAQLKADAVVIDIKSALGDGDLPATVHHWSL